MAGPPDEESYYDALPLDKMHRKQEKMSVEEKRGVRSLTENGGWVPRCNHLNHRGPRDNTSVGRADMASVRCRE